MQTFFDRAVEIATKAHFGTLDRCGKPYIEHPIRVASRLTGEILRTAAILHDVIEDTPVTARYLAEQGMPPEVVRLVVIVSRQKGETYRKFIDRICLDRDAIELKLADIADNSDPTRCPIDPDLRRQWHQVVRERYEPAVARLKLARNRFLSENSTTPPYNGT